MSYLSILSIMKNEAMNLKIWIDHYRWQGVDHFYIIDNGCTDTSVQIIEDLIKDGYPITLYKLSEPHKQEEHYRYVYDKEKLQEKTKWLIVADLDEFFYCNNSKISNELKKYEDYDLIKSKWRIFGSNNYIEHPKDIRISLTKREQKFNNSTKYIFQTKNIYSRYLECHNLNNGYINKIDLSEIFRLNHYQIQSREYFEKVKMTRGDAVYIDLNNGFRNWNYFDNINKNIDYEDNDLKNMILNDNINDNTDSSNNDLKNMILNDNINDNNDLKNMILNDNIDYFRFYYILFILLYFICDFFKILS